jgi:hypothetical protein
MRGQQPYGPANAGFEIPGLSSSLHAPRVGL